MKGKTSTGFKFEINEKSLKNYELVEMLADLEENPLILPKVVKLLLGNEQTKNLKDHVRDKETNTVDVEQMAKEISDIFQSQQEIKN